MQIIHLKQGPVEAEAKRGGSVVNVSVLGLNDPAYVNSLFDNNADRVGTTIKNKSISERLKQWHFESHKENINVGLEIKFQNLGRVIELEVRKTSMWVLKSNSKIWASYSLS
ncbi:hypothetical protein GQR58_029892 [Nymphon striatum]|nr:hypothetical protein GQR58_029892 [Nymphon striatum]